MLRRRKRAWYNEARVQGSRVAGTPGLRADARLAMGPISGFGWEARFSISHASCPRPSTKRPRGRLYSEHVAPGTDSCCYVTAGGG